LHKKDVNSTSELGIIDPKTLEVGGWAFSSTNPTVRSGRSTWIPRTTITASMQGHLRCHPAACGDSRWPLQPRPHSIGR